MPHRTAPGWPKAAAYPVTAQSAEQLRSSKLTGVDPPREMAQAFAFASNNSRTIHEEHNTLSNHGKVSSGQTYPTFCTPYQIYTDMELKYSSS